MRARNIKPGIFRNEFFGTSDPLYTILFQGLWMIADREGRLEDRPMLIKADVFPYRENVDINGMLTVIEREGFIQRYVVGGKKYIQVKNFKEHQKPHNTEKQSVIPPPDNITVNNGEPTVNPPLDNAPDSLIHRFTDSLIHPLTRDARASSQPENDPGPEKQKITLETISVDHNAEWLAKKRSQGRYVHHDEHFILEQFKQYCNSKGKKYKDYLDAYRNAFEWERCQPKQIFYNAGATKQDRAKAAILRGLGIADTG